MLGVRSGLTRQADWHLADQVPAKGILIGILSVGNGRVPSITGTRKLVDVWLNSFPNNILVNKV